MSTTAIVGDIHGNRERLESALKSLWNEVSEIIFVGDYIDRGSDSQGVLERLTELSFHTSKAVRFLRGNHDQALLDFLETGTRTNFIAHGGLSTAQSYLSKHEPTKRPLDKFRQVFPSHHTTFLKKTTLFIERPGLLISHCGFDPDRPKYRGVDAMVTGSFPKLFYEPGSLPQETVIFGHYVQDSGEPYSSNGLYCIDTGCGTLDQNPLTVMILPTCEIIQF